MTLQVRIRGDSDLAQAYLGYGRSLLARVKQLAKQEGVPVRVLHGTLHGGVILRAGVMHGVEYIDIDVRPLQVEGEGQERREFRTLPLVSRLYWVPEGFVCTPRNRDTAPDGWGIPDDTPGGKLPGVLINHYPHNNYPDVIFRMLYPPRGFKRTVGDVEETARMQWKAAPGLFMEYEKDLMVMDDPLPDGNPNWLPLTGGEQPVGIYDPRINLPGVGEVLEWPEPWAVWTAPGWLPAVEDRAGLADVRTLPQISEPRDPEQWFVHRAQPAELMRFEEYDQLKPGERLALMNDLSRYVVVDSMTDDVMEGVNQLRAAAGAAPVGKMPLRGDDGLLTACIIDEIRGIGSIPHESEEFREGYQLLRQRVRRSLKGMGAENLAFAPGLEEPYQSLGEQFVALWRDSPIHYENIITAWPNEDDPEQSYAQGPVGFASGQYLQGSDPAMGGLFAAQTFDRVDGWPWPKTAHHVGDFGTVGWTSEPITSRCHVSTGPTSRQRKFYSPQVLLLSGFVTIPRYNGETALVLGAALCGRLPLRDGSPECVRIAVLSGPFGTDQPLTLRVETWALEDLPTDEAEPLEEAEVELPPCARVQRFNFSKDGAKGGAVVYGQLDPYIGLRFHFRRADFRGSDGGGVNPGTFAQPVRYSAGQLSLGQRQTLKVQVETSTVDRDRTSADDGILPDGDIVRTNQYRAVCQGEYVAYLDYADDGTELQGVVSVDIETELKGPHVLESPSEEEAWVSWWGRNKTDGEMNYGYTVRFPGDVVRDFPVPDSRGFPKPEGAVYIHRERITLTAPGFELVLTDYENLDHWGAGAGVLRLPSHIDLRNPQDTLVYKAEFAGGGCREAWELGGEEVGDVLDNSYRGVRNFVGNPRYIPAIVAGLAIRQGVGRMVTYFGEDYFQPPYPTDLTNEKYASDFWVGGFMIPEDSNGRTETAVPAEDFYAVLTPDVNEGWKYNGLVGNGVSNSLFECSWRVGPRCVVPAVTTVPDESLLDTVQLYRDELVVQYRGQLVKHGGERLWHTHCAALVGNPLATRDRPNTWGSSISDLADMLGIDEHDDIGDIGVA